MNRKERQSFNGMNCFNWKFTGCGNDNDANFLCEFESFCIFQNLMDDKKKTAAFHLHFRGPALVLYNNLDSLVKSNWASVGASFVSQYAKHDMFDPNMVAESAIFES